MINKFLLAISLVTTTVLYSQASHEVEQLDSIFIDTKTHIPRKNSGKVVTQISSEILERSAGRSVADLLNEVSGIEINGSRSNDGQTLGYFIRGGRNRQVVILVDGVQLNDPSQISNSYDLHLLPATAIERIEIIKGASSVLYGSGAATAVINITTKGVSTASISGIFSSTIGTNRATENQNSDLEEFTNYASVNGTLSKFFYNLNFSNRYVDGLSAVAAPENEPSFEEDVFNRFDGNLKLGYTFSDNLEISRFFSFDKYKSDFDDFSYVDASNQSISEQKRTGGKIVWKHAKGAVTINDNYSWIDRNISSSYPAKFESESFTFDAFANQRLTNKLGLLVGLNGNFSHFDSYSIPFGGIDLVKNVDSSIAKFNIIDPYINVTYMSDFGLNLNAGGRLNIHSNYGNHMVYNFNPSFNFNLGEHQLKLLGSYSTAYITPSLFQLYDPTYGNEELQPEENTTIEGGFEYTSKNHLRVSALYFGRNESQYVDFVLIDPDTFTYRYKNIDEDFNTSGVEVELSKRFANSFSVTANYTFTEVEERFAMRIPKHKVNANILYMLGERSHIGLAYQFNSEREDSFFNPDTFETENVTLESYGLLHLTASHRFTKNLKLFVSVSNILDTEYTELHRYQTKGRNFRGGFTLAF